jgi:hypothetical protein
MKLTKVNYLASPYTFKGPNISEACRLRVENLRYRQITKIAGKLEDRYPYAFILPITMSHNTAQFMETRKEGTFKNWARRDFSYINKCDEVWVVTMDGWKESVGVQEEIKFATNNSIPVNYVHPVTLKVTKRPL